MRALFFHISYDLCKTKVEESLLSMCISIVRFLFILTPSSSKSSSQAAKTATNKIEKSYLFLTFGELPFKTEAHPTPLAASQIPFYEDILERATDF